MQFNIFMKIIREMEAASILLLINYEQYYVSINISDTCRPAAAVV